MRRLTANLTMVSRGLCNILSTCLDLLIHVGMQPVLYSTATGTWSRIGADILYYRNNFIYHKRVNESSTSEGNSSTGNGRKKSATGKYRLKSGKSCLVKKFYTLTFTVTFPLEKDLCYIAYHYPYTVTMLKVNNSLLQTNTLCIVILRFKNDLSLMEEYLHLAAPNQLYYNRQELCPTLSNNSCPLITITNLPPVSPSPKDDATVDKEYIVLSSRVHPGESNSSWIMQGKVMGSTKRLYTSINNHTPLFKVSSNS